MKIYPPTPKKRQVAIGISGVGKIHNPSLIWYTLYSFYAIYNFILRPTIEL
jgi:hypothetical protein